MPTLNPGDRRFLNLEAGKVLTVVCDAVSTAIVRGYPVSVGGEATSSAPVAVGSTLVRGPYGATTRWCVEASGFGVSYSMDVSSAADVVLDSSGQAAANGSPVSGAGNSKRVRSTLGAEAFDLVAISGLPAGASFSGSGSYGSAGILAVQSTGTIRHNPTGWYDGTACLEFTPSQASAAEFRIYNAAGLNISDDDGIAFEFKLPEMDTTQSGFQINFDYSSDATNLFPTNSAAVRVWVCDQTNAQTKEKAGRKYIRQRWDHDATDANCGAWPGYGQTTSGTGADRTALVKWIRFRCSQFNGKTIKFKAVRRGGRSTPCFVLGSDNATPEELVSRAFAYAGSKGLPLYMAQYISAFQTDPKAFDGAKRAYAGGCDMPGDDLVDRPLGSTVLDEATMRAAVEGTKAAMAAYGFTRGAKFWVANNNNTSYLMIRELARAGYVANRNGATDGRYIFPEGGVPDSFRLPGFGMDNLNFTAIQPVLDRNITYGSTIFPYWHGTLSTARMDADRTANITGTAGAPIARSGTESPAQYRARAAALGTAVGNASVAYFDARIGASAHCIWWEELKQVFDYLAAKDRDGSAAVLGVEQWCRDVGLLT